MTAGDLVPATDRTGSSPVTAFLTRLLANAGVILPVSFDWTSTAKEASLADIGEGRAVDDDHRELANRLFATATAMLEEAIEMAVAGQSPRLNPLQLADLGGRLQAAARDIGVVAEAAAIVADLAANPRQNRHNSRR